MINKLFILFTVLAFPLMGKAGELPTEFFSMAMYADYFRPNIENKITQMGQNFIRVVSPGEVYFFSNKEVKCQNGKAVPARQKIMSIRFNKELKDGVYRESRIYKGCGGHASFRETLIVTGAKEELHTDKEIHEGKMDLESPEILTGMTYELKDAQSELVFGGYFKRLGSSTSSVFKMGSNKFLTRTTTKMDTGKKVALRYYPFDFNQERNGFKMDYHSDRDYSLMAMITDLNTIYYGSGRQRISMAQFQEKFNLFGLDKVMDSMLAELPETKFVTTGAQDSKMLEELRTAQTFLISGTQLNLVRDLVEKYIKAVEEGSIVDNR